MLAIIQKQFGNSSIVSMNANASNEQVVYNDLNSGFLSSAMVSQGLAGAFQPAWSTDGEWLTFGVGFWLVVVS